MQSIIVIFYPLYFFCLLISEQLYFITIFIWQTILKNLFATRLTKEIEFKYEEKEVEYFIVNPQTGEIKLKMKELIESLIITLRTIKIY